MGKKQKDTSWELPAGIRETGLNNLTQTLGMRSREVVERLHNDKQFLTAAGKALIGLFDGTEPVETGPSLETVKQFMGGRCFLPDEAQTMLGLQHREVASIPKLTGSQVKALISFLKGICPVQGDRPAYQTHILFPQPSMIAGATFGVQWVLDYSLSKLGVGIDFCGGSRSPIPDSCFNQVRDAQWFLMYWEPGNGSAAPRSANLDKLYQTLDYSIPDLATYTLAVGYQNKRGVDVTCGPIRRSGGDTAALLRNDLYACRTVDRTLGIYRDREEGRTPALIKRVPIR